ncbi:YidB family protein [Craterilacuibacter sp.]|uniref:YidB family protein n=1 Tax=Craterilacuibacter sp. TaxID=2870909 RepID=UPI003F33ED18
MGLLDQLTGALGSSTEGAEGQGGLMGAMGALLEQNGGLGGLVEKFQQGGLGDVVSSWISTGDNQAIAASQIEQVLGNEQIAALAGKIGLDTSQVAQSLATALPQLVDTLTPNGELPAGNSDLLAQGSSLLKGLFGKS